MQTAEIRRRWLDFFERKEHTVVPSASLVSSDPSLMFTVAGMVPFIPYLTAQVPAPYKRATSVQKCLRTLDIDEVGKTTRHGTFFQMNGNFSFGDYFKREAVAFAWELLTTPEADGGLGFDPERLWTTVYLDDDEAFQLWREVGMPAERIQRRGKADNYWNTGQPGPGGPCSEIYFDRGPAYGAEGGPEADEDRYIEIWNLVFMQYQLSAVRTKVDFDVEGELPAKNIDTGMGLERVAFLKQGVDNMYEIDEVRPVLDKAAELSGRRYGAVHEDDVRMRVVADHVRSALMLIGDGVTPGNEGAGYVLRRLVRRAVRAMRLLGVEEPALPHLLPASMEVMSASYPQLRSDFERISAVAYAEEDAFRRTLVSGTAIFETAVAQTKAAGGSSLSGERAFALHDTYGFPIDLTLEMAAEAGVGVDEPGFRALMAEQVGRAKADAKAKKTGGVDLAIYRSTLEQLPAPVVFTGYEAAAGEARISVVLQGGVSTPSAPAGTDVEVVLDRTPFYAEGGGQLADHGTVTTTSGAVLAVSDVQQPVRGLYVHKGTVTSGELVAGDAVHAVVDAGRRRSISRAHTATHLVHQVVREHLGDTATQAGSQNAPGRMRFDYRSTAQVAGDVVRDIEAVVNERIHDDLEVSAAVMDRESALNSGAMALFGEKYGEKVRVVSIGEDWSKELCGGTHTLTSQQVGLVSIVSESSIGSGARRIEALVGADAFDFLTREHLLVNQLTEVVKARPEELPDRIGALLTRLGDAEKEIARLRGGQVLALAPTIAAKPVDKFGVRVVTHDAGPVSADDLRTLVLDVRSRLGEERPSVVAVAGVAKDRPVVVVATNAEARRWGVKAGELVRTAAKTLGGGGGGKDDLAQGGGQDPSKVPAALQGIEDFVGARVTGSV
ncbi:alanine--tRNA ligase [Kineococcus radiotolerans]|uniref:Alanine--tRNA ligase n=1 Tax=Kineococcus radiotolerans (strain ATCC BAA-149 / DSM 14245 / SRS30216) TaxID=266940 RepID=SYA_KINRD|nr:alanine--tRNA ligase [Kineococcus radiotolerans]A6WCF7.1 RecName: Full=Alanine--tRNA ligase; AltName: Full=Alanyl-tRNA synthetase; Short=AlaRS [Kineococcus radiotolerans SRS30216 = ATCC BAA-149]ABS04496.1 alanyl-tRNA synthetase [Kineococcus radiotolerans SRS30216 = ATCC BAA-149]